MVAPRALTAKQEEAVAKKYAKGTSSQALADEYGVHRSTIVTAVRRNGGTLRKAGGSKPRPITPKATVTKAPVKSASKAKKAVKKVAARAK